jgi:hypothetical protein
MRDVARQLRTDFTTVPDLVDRYVVHTPRDEAIKAARQVCGVTHYLSLMATGRAHMHRCALFGVTIVCIDEVTDELGEKLYLDPIHDAFDGDPPFASLEIIPEMDTMAKSPRFGEAITHIAKAQDQSLSQFDDITPSLAEAITLKKGGWSARANLATVKPDIGMTEWDAAWEFGSLMQQLDDYLDKPKDVDAGLSTMYSLGEWDKQHLHNEIKRVEEIAAAEWGKSRAHKRFFRICRLHRILGQIENETPLKAAWFAPGYL